MKILFSYGLVTLFLIANSIIISLTSISFKLIQEATGLFSPNYQMAELSDETFKLIHNQQTIIEFNRLKQQYTFSEFQHLLDVQKLVTYTKLFWILAVVVIIFLLPHQNSQQFKKFASLNLALIVLFLTFGVLFWDQIFALFHQLLFPPGTWSFPTDSLLIQNFPVVFWQLSSLAFITIFAITNLAILSWRKFKLLSPS